MMLRGTHVHINARIQLYLKWDGKSKQNYVRLNLNLHELLAGRTADQHIHPSIHTWYWYVSHTDSTSDSTETLRSIPYNLSDRSWGVCVFVCVLLLRFFAVMPASHILHMCVRVSVSFTSTVNYVGIHIAQHNKITNRQAQQKNSLLNMTESGQEADCLYRFSHTAISY